MVQRLLACAQSSGRRYRSDRARIEPPGPGPRAGTAQVARPPVQSTGLITSDDYPAAALRAEEQGAVTVEMAVSADGRVTGCSVRVSSGSSRLDSATCALAVRRFRFTPAADARGRPVAGTASRTVVWRIPEPPPVIEPKG
jgi:protein TonB